ncbi:NAD(P)H-binding protein [Methylobacterium sp. WL64]|uniref:NAD(P)H-binding protein n=1 Tax=Methylobacterium sp. WL64 TaxID=2603894 RepID=UPI0011CB6058|nr:NAD(P)H-binding protein [Methylobacterium sp. WL64]TXN00744.1 NAD(P)H-binding protein [Methylobacterium sp. WL64]
MIVVTGATGQLGRAIVERLLDRVPADWIGASVRDPGKAEDLANRGVRVRHGDFADPSSLETAFEGASQVLIVSSNARASGGDTLAQHHAAIAAAKAAGAGRIVYTSHMGASATSAFPPMHDHAATEAMLAQVGIAWTSLRNGFYASTVPMLIGDAVTSGVLAAPADGTVSWTTHADLAEAAALVLTGQVRFDGPTPPLTASEALDLADVAGILSDLLGRTIARRLTSDAEQETQLAARGLPSGAINIALGLFRASRANEFAIVDPTLTKLLGRAPTSLRGVLAVNGLPSVK